jgi:hypothetical protein
VIAVDLLDGLLKIVLQAERSIVREAFVTVAGSVGDVDSILNSLLEVCNALVVLEEGRNIAVESLKFDDETAKGKVSGH